MSVFVACMFGLRVHKVGIYGYVAYMASKFDLCGLVEALQQEVIWVNIHVSLIFPSDTDTPGLVEGNTLDTWAYFITYISTTFGI